MRVLFSLLTAFIHIECVRDVNPFQLSVVGLCTKKTKQVFTRLEPVKSHSAMKGIGKIDCTAHRLLTVTQWFCSYFRSVFFTLFHPLLLFARWVLQHSHRDGLTETAAAPGLPGLLGPVHPECFRVSTHHCCCPWCRVINLKGFV